MLSAAMAGSEAGASVYSKVLILFSHNVLVMVPMTEPSVKKSDTQPDRETREKIQQRLR